MTKIQPICNVILTSCVCWVITKKVISDHLPNILFFSHSNFQDFLVGVRGRSDIIQDREELNFWLHGSAQTTDDIIETDIDKLWFGLTDEAVGKA